ncbi:flagellar basal body protein [Pseudomonas sp. R2.Fl]|nr:flagellar basal body protein [Pseudomonas sp. R2.Fl]
MSISAVMGIALSGMQAQTTRATATANNVANTLTPGYDRRVSDFVTAPGGGVAATVSPSGEPIPPGGSNVDLAREMLDLADTEIAFKANAAVWETGAEIWDVLLGIKRD